MLFVSRSLYDNNDDKCIYYNHLYVGFYPVINMHMYIWMSSAFFSLKDYTKKVYSLFECLSFKKKVWYILFKSCF